MSQAIQPTPETLDLSAADPKVGNKLAEIDI
jgi:hypothetical protein